MNKFIKPSIIITDSHDINKVVNSAWSGASNRSESSNLLTSPLQYRNLPYIVFKITSSMLFRDFLAQFNSINLWAESKRRLSIHKPTHESNLMEEHSDQLPELREYIANVQEQVASGFIEINRDLLPMGTSTDYYISVNFNQLAEIIALIDDNLPIFTVYSSLFTKLLPELRGNGFVTSHTKSLMREPLGESLIRHDQFNSVFSFTCSHSIYAQVSRHKNITKYGYLSKLINSTSYDYLYGDSIHTTLVADREVISSMISLRMCAFSQSSGTSINSWYPIICSWLGREVTLTDLFTYLPCQGCCKSCYLHDEMKKEVDCPILNGNYSRLVSRFNNKLGDSYQLLYKVRKCSKCS